MRWLIITPIHSGLLNVLHKTQNGSRDQNPSIGLSDTVREGALSSAQVIAFLTGHRVEGYDLGEALAKDVTEQGLVEQFTRSVPPGFIGPITALGHTCDMVRNVGTDDQGRPKLKLDPGKLAILKGGKRFFDADRARVWQKHVDNPEENKRET